MSSETNYNPDSYDSNLARILARMDAQDASLARIEAGVAKTNGRVSDLEREKWYQRGIVAAVGLISAGLWQWFNRK